MMFDGIREAERGFAPMRKEKRTDYKIITWFVVVSFMILPIITTIKCSAGTSSDKKPEPQPDPSGVDHRLWDYCLHTYVENGSVDYQGIKNESLFKIYLNQLSRAEPAKLPTDNHRLALLCNAYNAFVIDGVIKHDITESVRNYSSGLLGLTNFFEVKEHRFAKKTVSLDHIEHGTIREEYEEPRIHMALVCAAVSCPPLRGEAYIGEKLEQQLEDQAHLFANDPKYVRFDPEANTIYLSKILYWYGDDFDVVGGILSFLIKRVEDTDMKEALQKAKTGEVDISYNEYDWSLNAQ